MKEKDDTEEIKVNYYPFYRSLFESLRRQTFEDAGKIAIAIGEKVFNKKEPQLEDHLMSIYLLIEPNILNAVENLIKKSKAGRMGGAPKGNKNALRQTHLNTEQSQDYQKQRIEREMEIEKEKDIINSELSFAKKKKEPFHKPSLSEIRAYCSEQHYSVNPETFFDYYESNGWKVGKNPMKDWKAAVRTWQRNERKTEDYSKDSFNRGLTNQYSKEDFKKLEEQLLDN